MHTGTTATKYGRGEIIAMSVAPRVMGFDYQPFAGKSIYEKKNRENYHGGKNEV